MLRLLSTIESLGRAMNAPNVLVHDMISVSATQVDLLQLLHFPLHPRRKAAPGEVGRSRPADDGPSSS